MSVATLRKPTESTSIGSVTNWFAIAAAALAMVATMPGRTHGLGLITEPLLQHFQLDRVDYGTINLWATLIGATFCLPAGRLVHRLGERPVFAGVVVALGGCVLHMTRLNAIWSFAVLVLLTRGLGQSALSVVSLGIVGRTVSRRAGLPMGVYSVLIGVGFIVTFCSLERPLANGVSTGDSSGRSLAQSYWSAWYRRVGFFWAATVPKSAG